MPLTAFGLVVVAATVGNAQGGAAGRETALVAVSVMAVGLALLLGSSELRRQAASERLARAGREGVASGVAACGTGSEPPVAGLEPTL